jgi:hypothetical protein
MPSIIKNSSVRATHPGASFARPSATRACEKSVELLRQGGVVHALQLTCSCGDTTVVELDYPQPHLPEESAEVSA